MATDSRSTGYQENPPHKKNVAVVKGPQHFHAKRGIQTSLACSPCGEKKIGGIPSQQLTGADRDLEDKIKKVTLKSVKLIHLGDTLGPSYKIENEERHLEIEIPSLLQCTPKYSPNGDQIGFTAEKKELREIFKDFKSGVMLFTGPAGSGKTTLLKTIAHDVFNKKYEGLREVDIVLFLKCGDLNCNKLTTESKLLLSNIEPELNEDEQKTFENIVRTSPEKVLIMLDGLDTFPSSFYDRSVKSNVPRKNKQKQVYDIISELLKGKLYPQCRVITSSREMNFDQLVIGASRSVYLDGLEENSIYRIGKQFLGPKEAEKLMQMLESHPLLMNLCRTPMFLISTLLGRRENPDFSPSKMSENLLHLINRFVHSQHCQMKMDDIKRLKKLAFDLLKRKQLNFSSEMLSEYGLDPKKVTGLIFRTGKNNRVMFFVHQFIHEMFASLHMADLEESVFKSETNECTDLSNFFLTTRLLGGIVSNDSICNQAVKLELLTHGTNLHQKREILKKILTERIDKFNDKSPPFSMLQILLILHECGDMVDDIIEKHLRRIDLKFSNPHALSMSDLLALASVAVKAQNLDNLTLFRCGLNQRHIDALSTFFEGKNVKIRNVDFSQNDLTDGAIKKIGSIVSFCKVQELNISATLGLHSENPEHSLFSLKEALQDYKLKTLNISYNDVMLTEDKMTEAITEITGEFVYELKKSDEVENFRHIMPPPEIRWKVTQRQGLWKTASYDFLRSVRNLIPNVTEKIVLCCWKFSPEWVEILKSNLRDHGQKDLQLVLAKDRILTNTKHAHSQSGGIGSLCSIREPLMKLTIASKQETEEIPKYETKVSEISHESVDKARAGQKYQVLHREKTTEDVKMFSEMISKNDYLEEVELCDCQVDSDFLMNLVEKAKNRGKEVQVKNFTIAATQGIDEMIPSICQFMKEFKTDGLTLEDSNGTEEMLNILHKNLIKFQVQLVRLDLSYNANLQDFEELGMLVSGRVKELILVNCGLEMNSLRSLQENIGESKVRYLDISYNTELDEDSISLLPDILCKYEPVSLIMHGCELSEDIMDGFIGFKDMQIEMLDLSCNDTLESGGMGQLGKIVSKHKTKEFVLSSCDLDGEGIDFCTDELENCTLRKLDLSHNSRIAPHPQKMVRLLKKSRVQHLDISSCKMTSKQIQHLADEMVQNKIKLRYINLSDTDRCRIDEEYINAILMLSQQVDNQFVLVLPGVSDEQKGFLPQSEKMVYETEGTKN